MLSQEHFIGYVTTTSNNTFTNNFETNGTPYALQPILALVSPADKIDIFSVGEKRAEKSVWSPQVTIGY